MIVKKSVIKYKKNKTKRETDFFFIFFIFFLSLFVYLFRKKPWWCGAKIHREDQSDSRRGKRRRKNFPRVTKKESSSVSPQRCSLFSILTVKVFWLSVPGLYHLHGEACNVVRLRRRPAAERHQARTGGQTWQMWSHVPSAVPGGHVQQWQ